MSESMNLEALNALTLDITSKQTFNIDALKGHWSVIYFYPKDATPGCTTEGQNFRDHYGQFKQLGVEIFGVSRDSIASHEKFKEKQNFPFELISDPDEVLCQIFDVIKEKKNFGKTYMGIVRSTFLLNEKQEIVKEWRSVRVKGHVEAVLEAVKEAQA